MTSGYCGRITLSLSLSLSARADVFESAIKTLANIKNLTLLFLLTL